MDAGGPDYLADEQLAAALRRLVTPAQYALIVRRLRVKVATATGDERALLEDALRMIERGQPK